MAVAHIVALAALTRRGRCCCLRWTSALLSGSIPWAEFNRRGASSQGSQTFRLISTSAAVQRKNAAASGPEKYTEAFIKKQIEEFNIGKRHLANMMGEDPESFSQEDIDRAIAYLFPSGLFDKKARPIMKHPNEIFPKQRAIQWGEDGRPFHYLFYTGKQSYYSLMHPTFHGGRESTQVLSRSLITQLSSSKPFAFVLAGNGATQGVKELQPGNMPNHLYVHYQLHMAYGLEQQRLDHMETYAKMLVIQAHQDRMTAKGLTSDNVKQLSLVGSRWLIKEELEEILVEPISNPDYARFIQLMERLLMFPYCAIEEEYVLRFRKQLEVESKKQVISPLEYDERGVAFSTAEGKKKTSRAQVKLYDDGKGKITVNGVDCLHYFPVLQDREQLMFPFQFLDRLGKHDMECTVSGGGRSSQANAIRLASSRALLSFVTEVDMEHMRQAGLLTVDPRVKERKKPGQEGARRKFTWKKR